MNLDMGLSMGKQLAKRELELTKVQMGGYVNEKIDELYWMAKTKDITVDGTSRTKIKNMNIQSDKMIDVFNDMFVAKDYKDVEKVYGKYFNND